MATNSFKVGDTLCLKGVSRHGKTRIDQHGEIWSVDGLGIFDGKPAVRVKSENKTFRLGRFGKKTFDQRWVHLNNDSDFHIVGDAI